MTKLSEIQLTMAKQISAKELALAKFKLMIDGDNKMTVLKGKKFVKIEYVEGLDTYTVGLGKIKKDFTYDCEEFKDVYFDSLKGYIQSHFKFEYVMHMFGG